MPNSRMVRGFTPRSSSIRSESSLISWESSLLGWTNLYWKIQAQEWVKWNFPIKNSVSKVLRKNLKKKSTFEQKFYPGQYQTSKPIGVRMGKGKGKISTRITWLPQGKILYEGKGLFSILQKTTLILSSRTKSNLFISSRKW